MGTSRCSNWAGAGQLASVLTLAACIRIVACGGNALYRDERPGAAGAGREAGSGGVDGTAGLAGGGGTAGAAVSTPCGAATCGPLEQCWQDRLCVAKLVPVTGGYAIDATEVTRSQYEAWLATNPPASGQPAYCSWNADLAPVSFCMAQKSVCKTDCASHPQVCVDWCDAYAYCKAVGKRSCGGRSGGATAYLDYEVAAASQWQNACSSGGVHNYPYGGAVGAGAMDGFEPKACNGFEKGVFTTMPVGSLGACQSSEPGYGWVFDLSGNALEWEDSCKTSVGDGDRCRLRGGYFGYAGAGLRCGKDMYKYRGDADETTGIRCCSP